MEIESCPKCGQEFPLLELISHAEGCSGKDVAASIDAKPDIKPDIKPMPSPQQIQDVDEVIDVEDGDQVTPGGIRELHESSSATPILQVIDLQGVGNTRYRCVSSSCFVFLKQHNY